MGGEHTEEFSQAGCIHVQQIQAVGRARFEQRLGTLTDQEFFEIASRIQELLGIT